MGAPDKGIEAAEQPAAESLLSAFKTISDPERRRHASLLNYWLSIRGDKEFPPLHDLDPLEISDAGPSSILLELASGGHDAQVRHLGEAIPGEMKVDQIIDAPSPSILASIAKKLPIVAISRDFLAFEDEFESGGGPTRCWVTLLPLSAGGAWVDYVYALVTVEGASGTAEEPAVEPPPVEVDSEEPPEAADAALEVAEPAESAIPDQSEKVDEVPPDAAEDQVEAAPYYDEPEATEEPAAKPGFAKLFDSLVGLTNFYGSEPVKVEPVISEEAPVENPPVAEQPVEEPAADPMTEDVAEESAEAEQPVAEAPPIEDIADEAPEAESAAEEPVAEAPSVEEIADEAPAAESAAEEPAESPIPASEGTLQGKLADVRSKADEARMAKLKANAALYDGLSAAYDFALDAEDAPEEYLRLVEAQGLKIQLRSPMKPVVKLAFDGLCDDSTIKQLEAVLAWAFKEELPRGTLAERIQSAGGIAPILSGDAAAA